MGETRLESPPNISQSNQIIVYSLYVEMNLYLQQTPSQIRTLQSQYLKSQYSLYLISITLSSTINDSAVSCCNIAELKSSSSHDVSYASNCSVVV